jgi:copper transport protein
MRRWWGLAAVVALAAVALAAVAVVGLAGPAAAHALLLRAEPGAQSVLKRAPTAVRLVFSEPVEVNPGWVRVLDVSGRRVDRGAPTRSDGNRTVVQPVGGLSEGTYTVSWRAVSADSHPARGGFVFYVGRPSPNSPMPLESEQATPPVVEIGYGVVRFAWFVGLLALVGMVVVRRLVWTPALRELELLGSPLADGFRRRFARALPAAWAVLAVAGLLSLWFQAATVEGTSLATAARPATLGAVLGSSFGRLWLVSVALVAALAVPVVALVRRTRLAGIDPRVWIWVGGLLVAGLAVVRGLDGHARTDSRPGLAVASLAAHLLAVGVWVGGLGALVALAGPGWRELRGKGSALLLRQLLPRFSRLAVAAVAVVVVTGVVSALGQLGSVFDLWRVAYGEVLLAKLTLVAMALAMARQHRFVLPDRLAAPKLRIRDAQATVSEFGRSSATELVTLLVAVAAAAALVAMIPGRTVALAGGLVNTSKPVGPWTVQLLLDPSTAGANELHLTFTDKDGLAAGKVSDVKGTLSRTDQPTSAAALRLQLLAPGHFAADVTLAAPARYRLAVQAPGAQTTFEFDVRSQGP